MTLVATIAGGQHSDSSPVARPTAPTAAETYPGARSKIERDAPGRIEMFEFVFGVVKFAFTMAHWAIDLALLPVQFALQILKAVL